MAILCFKFSDFELDRERFELRRNGQVVKLERIPMELLILLAERDGNVVTRQEIVERLWGKDVFVDTEHGINTAIRKIRSALQEDAERPHFVRTVPGKGYRFVAQVNNGHADTLDPPPEAGTRGSSEGVPAKPRDRWRFAGVAIVLLVVAVVLIRVNASRIRNQMRTSGTSHRIQSVAILPLVNLSGDADQEYFADGLTEQLTTDVGKISALRVISRTSVTQYKHTRKALPEIARELNVEAVIEGTVAHFGNRVRITASLVQASPEKQLWAETYESEVGDILTTQVDVARAVAREIQVEVTPEEQQRFSANPPVNPEAQDFYFKGLYAMQAGTAEATQNAIRYFQHGIQRDPNFAPPYAGLALAKAQWVLGESRPREKMTEAREAAIKALALDDTLPDGHYAFAMIRLFYDWDWTGAEKEFRRAIELNPNHALAHAFYARELIALGRTNEALAQAKQALELLPSPGVTDYPNWVFFLARRYDLAEPLARETVELVPNFAWGHYQLALVLEQMAKPKEAVQEYLKVESLSGTEPEKIARLEQALAQSGTQGYWKRRLEDYRESAKSRYVPSVVVAGVCLRVGDKDCAFEWLEKGFQERDDLMVNLAVDPAFDGLRGETRFRDLIRRVGLPD